MLSQYLLGNRDQNHIDTLLEKVELLNRKKIHYMFLVRVKNKEFLL